MATKTFFFYFYRVHAFVDLISPLLCAPHSPGTQQCSYDELFQSHPSAESSQSETEENTK